MPSRSTDAPRSRYAGSTYSFCGAARDRVDDRVRPESAHVGGDAAEGSPLDVDVLAWRQVGRLGLPPMYDHHVVAARRQQLDRTATDELRTPMIAIRIA